MANGLETLYDPQVVRYATGGAPLDELVNDYMQKQDPAYRATVEGDVATMERRATPIFMERVQRAQAVAPSVISFTEEHYIQRALKQYVRQRGETQRSAIGYLNWYPDAPERRIANMRGLLDEFIEHNPTTPFAYIEGEITEPLCMGALRKRVADTAANLVASDTPDDVLFTPHDADMALLNLTHMHDLRRAFDRHPLVLSVWPHVSHVRTPPTAERLGLPNMDMIIKWMDDLTTMLEADERFEPGPGFSLRAMLAVGGYNPTVQLSETYSLLQAIHGPKPISHPGCVPVPKAKLVQSPRRLYSKLLQHVGPPEFWTNQEGIRPDEDYRGYPEEFFARWPDLPARLRDDMLRDLGILYYQDVYKKLVATMTEEEAHTRARATMEGMRRRLGGPEDMFEGMEPSPSR